MYIPFLYSNLFQMFDLLLKMIEFDGIWSRLHGATALEEFNWNRKKCFDKVFFWLFNSIDVFLHIFACRHCRRLTNQRPPVSCQAKVTIFDQSESSSYHKWRLSSNQRALVTTCDDYRPIKELLTQTSSWRVLQKIQ